MKVIGYWERVRAYGVMGLVCGLSLNLFAGEEKARSSNPFAYASKMNTGAKLSSNSLSDKASQRKNVVGWSSSVYTAGQLEKAQEIAFQSGKPLVLISSRLNVSRDCDLASLEMEEALRDYAIMVVIQPQKDESRFIEPIRGALSQMGEIYPKGIVVDPKMKKILYMLPYDEDGPTRQMGYFNALTRISNFSKNEAATVKFIPSTKNLVCVQTLPVFDPHEPKNRLGEFLPGTILTLGALNRVPGMVEVTYQNPQGEEVKGLCHFDSLRY